MGTSQTQKNRSKVSKKTQKKKRMLLEIINKQDIEIYTLSKEIIESQI